ncbi:MAG: hypothetical protein PHR25_05890 [Clostridia bacterium]|nr:hypothetical protein [Clostridia bacterium]
MKREKTLKAKDYVIKKVGRVWADDLAFGGQYAYDSGYTVEEIAASYGVRVEDLRINTMTTHEAVKALYKIGWDLDSIAYIAQESADWVYNQLNQGKNKQVGKNPSNFKHFDDLGMAAKKAYV